MSSKGSYIVMFVAFLLIAISISGCTQGSGNTPPTAMDNANSSADNILHSIDSDNYSGFIRNMNESSLHLMNETMLQSVENFIHPYGHYVSKSAPATSVLNGLNVYVYNCTYTNGSVKLLLGMNMNNSSMVEGVRFLPN